jgi:hypothetical protein
MIFNATGLGLGSSPSTNLSVSGNGILSSSLSVGSSSQGSANLWLSGTLGVSYESATDNVTLGGHSLVFADSSSGNLTLTLPDATTMTGRLYKIKKIGASNNIQIFGTPSIDGNGSVVLVSGSRGYVKVMSNGTEWWALEMSSDAIFAGGSGILFVYEGFQYGTAGTDHGSSDLLDDQPDGAGGDTDATGLSGTWQEQDTVTTTSDLFIYSGSLSFGDLETNGNHVRTDTNGNHDRFARTISADIDSTSELWFSVMANKLQNNFSAAEGGFVIGNQPVNAPKVNEDDGTSGLAGFGFAPTTAGSNWKAYAWDGASQTAGDAALAVATNGSVTTLLYREDRLERWSRRHRSVLPI